MDIVVTTMSEFSGWLATDDVGLGSSIKNVGVLSQIASCGLA